MCWIMHLSYVILMRMPVYRNHTEVVEETSGVACLSLLGTVLHV